jgi:site-specific recombinase
MKFKKNIVVLKTVQDVFDDFFVAQKYSEDKIEFLVNLVALFRPKKPQTVASVSIEELLVFFKENPSYLNSFRFYLNSIVQKNKFSRLLSDAEILSGNVFFTEVKNRVFDKILPVQPEQETLQYVLNQVFYLDTDPLWINKIAYIEIEELFSLLNFQSIYSSVKEETILSEILLAMQLLTQRMSGRALENDVTKMVPEYAKLDSPFLALEKELILLDQQIRLTKEHYISSSDLLFKQMLLLHKQCKDYIDKAFLNSTKYGISVAVNQSLLRIRQQLSRVKELLFFMIVNKPSDKDKNSIFFIIKLIKYNCHKNKIRQLLSESTQLIAYEITQHTAKGGTKYIADSKKEYYKMFYNACGGGFIVGFLVLIKLYFFTVKTSEFGHAFLYSLNYSFGFVLIFLLGFTLATKQPAMTAATIAKTLEEARRDKSVRKYNYQSFAVLFSRIFRTQFIAFVGNVLIAFPVALLLIFGIDELTGVNVAEAKAEKFITDLSPFASLALIHAFIAGIYLFLSGIISGSVSNRNKHYQVFYRIVENPFMKRTFGRNKTKKIAEWVDANWAGVISNFWFGTFLGSTAIIGVFLGLNLDIRHITFASGNFALGLYGNHFNLSTTTILISILGIGLIGFINFIVSFSLSMLLAFRSRNIPLSEFLALGQAIWSYFKKSPFNFFLPLKDKSK